MKALTLKVNTVLSRMFDAAGMTLVDYKLEFGVANGKIYLGDEFSPDGCRIWDKATGEKMDKDRFVRTWATLSSSILRWASAWACPLIAEFAENAHMKKSGV